MTPGPVETGKLADWIGREESDDDRVRARVARQMAGLMGRPRPFADGDVLPAGWHWLYFNPVPAAANTGQDGHPLTGDFLPPVPLPRRMWAGSRVRITASPKVGQAIHRTSRVADVRARQGRSGRLFFVSVEHRVADRSDGRELLREVQDIVYLEAPRGPFQPRDGAASRRPAHWEEIVTPDPVMLFRYSALTFNGHRIHYDRDYARDVEGYPERIVHGPLTVLLLLDLVERRAGRGPVAGYEFRALSPLFAGDPVVLCGALEADSVRAWALDPRGLIALELEAWTAHPASRADALAGNDP